MLYQNAFGLSDFWPIQMFASHVVDTIKRMPDKKHIFIYHSASGLSGTRKTTPLDSGSASTLAGQWYELTGLNRWLHSIKKLQTICIFLSFCLLFSDSVLAEEEELAEEETAMESGDWREEEEYQEETTLRDKIDNLVLLLEENRGIELLADSFVYPFSADHKTMNASILVPSVKEGGPSGFGGRIVNKNTPKLASTNKTSGIKRLDGNLDSQGRDLDGGALQAGVNSQTKKTNAKKELRLPEFEISGKFGSRDEQFIVIGNRYYGVNDRLKGSRELKQVYLVGIDEQFAYFRYQDINFIKKIKALESIF